MVLSHYEVTQARFVNDTCQNARKIRKSMRLRLTANSFIEQVTLHRDVQNSVHILISSNNNHHSEEYKFNCTVLHNPSFFSRVFYKHICCGQSDLITFSLKVPLLIGPGWGQRKTELMRIRSQVHTDTQRERG
jgi:hypothetical protein